MTRPVSLLAVSGMAALLSGSAVFAQEALTSPTGLTKMTWYGQVNPAVTSFDDGAESKTTLVDNAASNTRVGFNLDVDYPDQGKLRFNFETSLGLRPSSGVSQTATPQGWRYELTNLRKFELIWTAGYGVISAGQGSMASDGSTGSDFSGTGLTNGVAIGDPVGGFSFRDTGGALGPTVSDVFKDLDGARRARIRYDTPQRAGFSFAVAYGVEVLREGDDNAYYDAALRYGDTFGGTRVAAALGYNVTDLDGGGTVEAIVGSASVLLENGLNLTVIAGDRQAGGDGSYYYVKGGWIGDFWDIGSSSFAIDYNESRDFAASGGKGTALGFGYTQKIDRYDLEAYLGYRTYTYDETGTDYQDASSWIVGTRWKF